MKTIKAHLSEKNPERVEAFEKGAQAFAKKIVANFKDYEFVCGELLASDYCSFPDEIVFARFSSTRARRWTPMA